MTEPNGPQWLEMLSTGQCVDYLREKRLGRVGFTLHDRPVILPVLYLVDNNCICFLTEEGSKLAAASAKNSSRTSSRPSTGTGSSPIAESTDSS